MSNVADIVLAITEGEDDFDFENDQKELIPPEWSIRMFYHDGLWNAQLLWGGSPYGVVAQHINQEVCRVKGEQMKMRFENESQAHMRIGMRVRSKHNGEKGTVTGIPGPNERWVHFDNDGDDPNSAARFQVDELDLMEGLDDEDDLKDAYIPSAFEARLKYIPTDNTYSVNFYFDGKFVGSSSGAETEDIAKNRMRNWLAEFARCQLKRPYVPGKNVDVWSWYYGFGDRPKHLPPLEEGLEDEDDFKFEVQNMFAKGQRVLVTTGTYAGEPGVVEGTFNWGNGEIGFWVHLDNSDDPNSAITYKFDSLKAITEAMEDDEAIPPKFTFNAVDPQNHSVFDIYNHDQWIGRITKGRAGFREEDTIWIPMWAPDKYDHAQPEAFKTPLQAAEWFHHHWYFAADKEAVQRIVREATEDDEDDSDWIKSLVHDPILMARSSLEAAGFEVNVCERQGDSIVLVISWPTPTASVKISGWKRACEILEPLIGKLKGGDYRADNFYRGLQGEERMVKVTLRKRLEDDPSLWRVEKKSQRQIGVEALWTVLFNGQEAGEFYATPEGAELLRRELVELHRLVPFYPVGWGEEAAGNAWGSGKAIAWWRILRHQLPKELQVATHHVDKNLIDPEDWRRP